jgi:ABC-type transport system substrate-binding protein
VTPLWNSSPKPDSGSTAAPGTAKPESARGRISRAGQTLTMVIGAAANDPTSVAVANTAADQLRSAGIAASVLALDPPELYGEALTENQVDAIVGWRAAGGDLATRLASRFGCPALEARPVATAGTPPARPGSPQGSPPPTTSTKPAEPPPLVLAPSNLTGICDRSIQPRIDGAMAGTLNISDVLTAVEPKLWAMATVLPIMQDTTIVAAGPSVQNVSLTGAVPVGIVGDAGRWVKTAP